MKKQTFISNLLSQYTAELEKLQQTLEQKRLEIGDADSAKESRFPTGRIELEKAIGMLERNIDILYQKIRNLKHAQSLPPSNTIQAGSFVILDFGGKHKAHLITKSLGDIDAGIISLESTIGQKLLEKKAGDTVEMPQMTITVMEIL